jgi:hypothetical protein
MERGSANVKDARDNAGLRRAFEGTTMGPYMRGSTPMLPTPMTAATGHDGRNWPDADLLQPLFLSQVLEAKRTHCAHRELF